MKTEAEIKKRLDFHKLECKIFPPLVRNTRIDHWIEILEWVLSDD